MLKVKTKKPSSVKNGLKPKEKLKVIKETASKLLKLLGMEKVKIQLSQDEEKKIIYLNIDCSNPGILIGSKGETINSLQLILCLMVYKKLGYWQKIIVNIAGYREKREEDLQQLAFNIAKKVKFSGKEESLFYLNAAERRIIHLTLADNPDVTTESIGEGKERTLIIKPKKGDE